MRDSDDLGRGHSNGQRGGRELMTGPVAWAGRHISAGTESLFRKVFLLHRKVFYAGGRSPRDFCHSQTLSLPPPLHLVGEGYS